MHGYTSGSLDSSRRSAPNAEPTAAVDAVAVNWLVPSTPVATLSIASGNLVHCGHARLHFIRWHSSLHSTVVMLAAVARRYYLGRYRRCRGGGMHNRSYIYPIVHCGVCGSHTEVIRGSAPLEPQKLHNPCRPNMGCVA